MSASNVFNNYNKLLLQENYYNFKYNPSKRKNQKEVIISLVNAIKNKDNEYVINNKNNNDSLSTLDAMYNPYLIKLSEENQYPLDSLKKNNKNYILNQRQISSTQRHNKAIDIQRYSECVKLPENKRPSSNIFLTSNYKKNKNKIFNSDRKRPLSFKKKCPCCNNIFQIPKKKEDNKFDNISEEHLNIYNNKNFKDSLSCFIYYINNFTSKEFENKKSNNENIERKININTDMISEFTKNLKKNRIKEIQRIHFDPSNFYFIQKPLIPTIRGKILKNMKKRYIRPIRNVVSIKSRVSSLNKYN